MIIHMWMHWFWITTAYFKGFIFFTGQTISISCISQPTVAEAGLLVNDTSTLPTINFNDSSQTGDVSPIITLLPLVNIKDEEGDNPPETTPHQLSSSPPGNPSNESTPKSEDLSSSTLSSTSDLEDTYNGGSLDTFQYPLKKFSKYSHLKYGKVRTKGKPSDEPLAEDRKSETVQIVEEKVNINISLDANGVGRSKEEVDKSNDSLSEGSTSEVPTSDASDLITTTLTSEDEGDASSRTLEYVLKDEPVRTDNVTGGPSAMATPTDQPDPTEDPKEAGIFKNETLVIENKVEETRVRTTVEPFVVKNRVAAATSAQNFEVDQMGLNAGSITGITLGILVFFSLFGAVSFVLYRRRYLNKPQVLHDKCSNLDSSGYIDETSLRENSEEMYSLDNDSFLNSLEAMTIQNYWTENVKHTKL